MIGCEKIRVRLDDWLDGLLDNEALGEVNDHLAFCEDCRRHFDTHLMLANNLSMLGKVADRMAEQTTATASGLRSRIWLRRITAAAACLMLAIGGVYYALRTDVPLLPSPPSIPIADVSPEKVIRHASHDRPAVPLGDLMVRPVDARRVSIDDTPDCVAVNVETSNPKVHLVWLYGNCASQPREKNQ